MERSSIPATGQRELSGEMDGETGGRRVSGVLGVRDMKATTFYELPPAPECDCIALATVKWARMRAEFTQRQ